jgi:hypothetical protein
VASSSASNGKAFEFIACKAISHLPDTHLTGRAHEKQIRDEREFENQDKVQKLALSLSAQFLASWLTSNSTAPREIDRPDDGLGEQGDPSDLIVKTPSKIHRISLKNGNESIKHQRPSNLAGQAGFPSSSIENMQWKSSYAKAVSDYFRSNHPGLAEIESDDLDSFSLYSAINSVAVDFLLEVVAKDPLAIKNLYEFLVGPPSLVLVTCTKKSVSIWRWSGNRENLTLEVDKSENFIFLKFSNGHEFSMRLHTASSSISCSSPSLKWDTQSDSFRELIARKSY